MASSGRERFDGLWSKYAGPIYAYAARRVGRGDADEIVSEVFAVAWRRIDDIPVRELPWLYGVGNNVIREHTLRWLDFADQGTGFYALIALGNGANPELLHTVERVLDSFTLVQG
jgi:hypothetical protein